MPYNLRSVSAMTAFPATPHVLVIVARPALAPVLRKHLATNPAVTVFAASEVLRALDSIIGQPPQVVALDPAFATTARGATLIARVRADLRLATVDLRILVQDETERPVLLEHPATSAVAVMAAASQPLDRCGTRGAVRFPMRREVVILVNGEPSQLVNLSVTGAQILSPNRLRPEQRIRVTLLDGSAETRFHGVIAWSALEMTGATGQYRAGLAFTDPDRHILDAFCLRHGTNPDRIFSP